MRIAKQQPSHRAENVAKTFPNATWEYHSVCCAKMKQKSAEHIPVVCTNRVFRFVAQCVLRFRLKTCSQFGCTRLRFCFTKCSGVASQCVCGVVSECVSGLHLRFRFGTCLVHSRFRLETRFPAFVFVMENVSKLTTMPHDSVSKCVSGFRLRFRNMFPVCRNGFAVSSRNVFPVCVCGFVSERVWCEFAVLS